MWTIPLRDIEIICSDAAWWNENKRQLKTADHETAAGGAGASNSCGTRAQIAEIEDGPHRQLSRNKTSKACCCAGLCRVACCRRLSCWCTRGRLSQCCITRPHVRTPGEDCSILAVAFRPSSNHDPGPILNAAVEAQQQHPASKAYLTAARPSNGCHGPTSSTTAGAAATKSHIQPAGAALAQSGSQIANKHGRNLSASPLQTAGRAQRHGQQPRVLAWADEHSTSGPNEAPLSGKACGSIEVDELAPVAQMSLSSELAPSFGHNTSESAKNDHSPTLHAENPSGIWRAIASAPSGAVRAPPVTLLEDGAVSDADAAGTARGDSRSTFRHVPHQSESEWHDLKIVELCGLQRPTAARELIRAAALSARYGASLASRICSSQQLLAVSFVQQPTAEEIHAALMSDLTRQRSSQLLKRDEECIVDHSRRLSRVLYPSVHTELLSALHSSHPALMAAAAATTSDASQSLSMATSSDGSVARQRTAMAGAQNSRAASRKRTASHIGEQTPRGRITPATLESPDADPLGTAMPATAVSRRLAWGDGDESTRDLEAQNGKQTSKLAAANDDVASASTELNINQARELKNDSVIPPNDPQAQPTADYRVTVLANRHTQPSEKDTNGEHRCSHPHIDATPVAMDQAARHGGVLPQEKARASSNAKQSSPTTGTDSKPPRHELQK